VDLMNEGTDVSRYLTNAVPSDLQLALGYFACKMRGPAETGLSVREGFDSEASYFAEHPSYGRAHAPYAERLADVRRRVGNANATLAQVQARLARIEDLADRLQVEEGLHLQRSGV